MHELYPICYIKKKLLLGEKHAIKYSICNRTHSVKKSPIAVISDNQSK